LSGSTNGHRTIELNTFEVVNDHAVITQTGLGGELLFTSGLLEGFVALEGNAVSVGEKSSNANKNESESSNEDAHCFRGKSFSFLKFRKKVY